jgi:hypothetical protein
MGIQVFFSILSLFNGAHWPSDFVYSGEAAQKMCFNFNAEKISKPLQELEIGNELKMHGTAAEDKKSTWAKVRGTVPKPLKAVLALLLDHNTTKSPKVDEMKVFKVESPHYLELHKVHYEINPFPLIWVKWDEQWAYALIKGSAAEPEEVLISYQKSEGTSHIEHLCGNIELKKLNESTTDVYQYEEAKATNRTSEDTMNGLIGTLETLRKK